MPIYEQYPVLLTEEQSLKYLFEIYMQPMMSIHSFRMESSQQFYVRCFSIQESVRYDIVVHDEKTGMPITIIVSSMAIPSELIKVHVVQLENKPGVNSETSP